MTLFRLHHDDVHGGDDGLAREKRISLRQALMHSLFRTLRRAIASARLRRLMFQRDYSEMFSPDQDATKIPRRPMVLGDKWDF